jgi:hypothetical protein
VKHFLSVKAPIRQAVTVFIRAYKFPGHFVMNLSSEICCVYVFRRLALLFLAKPHPLLSFIIGDFLVELIMGSNQLLDSFIHPASELLVARF